MVIFWSNFQGQLYYLQVIFGQVVWTLGPSGTGRHPQKGLFCQIYPSSQGFGAVGLWLFGNRTMRQKMLQGEFLFLATA